MRLTLTLACLSLVVATSSALTEESCSGTGQPMSRTAMEQSLRQRGYTEIRGLSLHNGCYEAKGSEHTIELVMSVADRVIVLNEGRKVADAPPDEVRADRAVLEAYLGHA